MQYRSKVVDRNNIYQLDYTVCHVLTAFLPDTVTPSGNAVKKKYVSLRAICLRTELLSLTLDVEAFRHAIRIVILVIVKNVNTEWTLITNTVDAWSAVLQISVTIKDADSMVIHRLVDRYVSTVHKFLTQPSVTQSKFATKTRSAMSSKRRSLVIFSTHLAVSVNTLV
eukprot:XP_019928639.1 PREDICTED: uncharacterized protein LOC105342643 [Crassostrea gigas]